MTSRTSLLMAIIAVVSLLIIMGIVYKGLVPEAADDKPIWADYATSNIVIIEYNPMSYLNIEALKSWLDENRNKRVCKIENLDGTWIVYYSKGGSLKEARCINR